MKTLLKNLAGILAVTAVASFAPACSCGDDDGGDGDGDVDSGVDGPDNVVFPTLGTQIDRSGRPAISTALIAAFEPDDAGGGSTTRDGIKIGYNSDDDPSSWIASYQAEVHKNIAIIDGIVDSDAANGVCGDQFGFGTFLGDANDYDGLAAGLALDFLLLNIGASCTDDPSDQNYLAVEASLETVVIGACGGRDPLDDVVDFSYSVLAGFPTDINDFPNVPDGVAGDEDAHNNDAFPFLAAVE